VYYLFSNNHINDLIVHQFDFGDEELVAYYVSFLKTLSLKLNENTLHFFFNEQANGVCVCACVCVCMCACFLILENGLTSL